MVYRIFYHLMTIFTLTLLPSSSSLFISPLQAQTPGSSQHGALPGNDPFPGRLARSDGRQIRALLEKQVDPPASSQAADGLPGQPVYFKASNTDQGDGFGTSVAVSGDLVAVGAPLEDSNATGVDGSQADNSSGQAGAAYVFARSGSGWIQQAYLKASNTDPADNFGCAVAAWGDTVVVGACGEDSSGDGGESDNSAGDAGAVYVFTRSGSSWTQQAYLKASNAESGDYFGYSVAIFENTIVAGALYEDSSAVGINGDEANNGAADSGAAYVFTRSGSSWTQQAYLKASNTEANDWFGYSVAVGNNDTLNDILVGAPWEDSDANGVGGDQSDNTAWDSGAAYYFTDSGSGWSQKAYLKAPNSDSNDLFGISVGLRVETAVVGAPSEDSAASGVNGDPNDNSLESSGAAYMFVCWTTCSYFAYLKASNPDSMDRFGWSVAATNGTLLVTARLEDSRSSGMNGDQDDNSASGSGAAYFFKYILGEGWKQQAYLKASNTETDDNFGWSAALDNDVLVVGARGEDSNATGVNGEQSDNSAVTSGAVYIPETTKYNFLPIITKSNTL